MTRLKSLLKSAFNVLVMILAIVGLMQVGSLLWDEPDVPVFTPLAESRPDLLPSRYAVKTRQVRNADSAELHWRALQPSLEMTAAINPAIADWMRGLHDRDRILWKESVTLFNWPVLASYVWYSDQFYFGPGFWQLPEGEKVAVMAHEYYHYRQSKLAMVGDTVLETLAGKLNEYGSRTEDEAHLYQSYACRAMDMPPSDIVFGYFHARPRFRFMATGP